MQFNGETLNVPRTRDFLKVASHDAQTKPVLRESENCLLFRGIAIAIAIAITIAITIDKFNVSNLGRGKQI